MMVSKDAKNDLRNGALVGFRNRHAVCKLLLLLTLFAVFTGSAFSQVLPLKPSSNGRYLTDQTGAPVFMDGDAGYSMIVGLTYAQSDQYLTDRAGRGVNVVIANLIDGDNGKVKGNPANANGAAPFTGANFTTPNPAYFALVDSMLSRANSLGITVLLFPLYIAGYWSSPIINAGDAGMTSWGSYLGNRYKNYPNIIWVIGGDNDGNPIGSTVKSRYDSFVAGLKTTDTVYPRLITGHSARGYVASTVFTSSWLNLNAVYSSVGDLVTLSNSAYASPVKPFFNIEALYEHETAYVSNVRAEAYWTILRGGCGYVFGNCPMWGFGSSDATSNCPTWGSWQSNLNSIGSQDMTFVKNLFTSRHWYSLVPDNGTVLTAGAGSGTDLATFAAASDGSCIIGYLPSSRSVTVNPTKISTSQIHVQWYNPQTGGYTEVGTFATGSRSYTPPSDADWVLVLDGVGATGTTPPSPVLATPANGTTGTPVNPTLTWNASTGATSYRVQVSTDPAFGTTVVDQSGIAATSLAVSGLANNTTYYWRVSATNATGTSAYSTGWSFTTVVATPTAPVLLSPANAATGISISPTLSWSTSSGATSYRVQVSTDPAFGTTVKDQSGLTVTSLVLSGLANGTTYYWRVNASNGGGTSGYSPIWSFVTIVAVPAPPTLTSPTNGATGIAINPTLLWNASAGATSYRVQVSSDAAFGTTMVDQSGIAATSLAISGLANNTTYYWRVSASNSAGPGSYSTVWNFATLSQVTVPPTPVPISPANAATGISTSPTLTWNVSSGATSYRVQVSTDNNFGTNVVDQSGIVTNSLPLSGLTNGTTYFWRINATNSAGTSAYSTGWTFTTIVAPPATPSLVGPANGGTGIALNPTLSWNVSNGATSYRVQVATDTAFATIFINQSGIVANSFAITGLANNTIYHWRVSGSNAGGTSAFSAIWSFTTIATTPAAPTLAAPVNAATDIPLSPTLTWNASSGATSYRVQVSTDAAFGTAAVDQSGITATSLTLSSLTNNTVYYWRVNAANSAGTSNYSTSWSFTTVSQVSSQLLPLKPSSNGRYLTDQTGAPVFMDGDAGYSMIVGLTYAQSDQYLTDRAGRGVNVVIANLIDGDNGKVKGNPANANGAAPFTGANFTTPNPAYFALVDSMLSRANSLGITVLLFPLYIAGYWSSPIINAGDAGMTSWGSYLGNRYKNYPNIIWVIGGDNDGNPIGSTVKSRYDSFVAGLKTTDTVYPRLITGHSARGYVASTVFTSSWLNLNAVYSSVGDLVTLSNSAYASPVKPFFNIEALYEHETGYIQTVRSEAYWTILRGGCGYVFGNCPMWGFGSSDATSNCPTWGSWQSNLNSIGSQDMTFVKNLFTSRHWYSLVPDNGTVLTAGAGSGTDLATFAAASDGSCIIGYLPSSRSVTVNPTKISTSQIHVQWYNPQTGGYTEVGTFATGSRSYTPPSDADWVLVLDGVGATGTTPPSPVLATPANGTTGTPVNPTLTWNASTGATSYRVQVSTDPAFGTTVVDQSGIAATSLAVSGLANNTTHYWRVSATNASGTSAYSTVWSFSTAQLVNVPAAPALVTPANASAGIPVNPSLVWNASNTATSYRVQVSADPAFGTTVVDQSGIAATTLSIAGLTNSTVYYWRVNASNAVGAGPFSAVWSFTTVGSVSPPPPPTLRSPTNGSTGIALSPLLRWNTATGATSYQLQVSTSAQFTTTVVDQSNIATTSLTISGLATNTTYYWRVNASNGGGTSAYSTVWHFTTTRNRRSSATAGMDSAQVAELAPSFFSLEQNYPNPFNPTTRIEFTLTSPATVSLEVFDVLGRKVRTLIDGELGVGTHSFEWNSLDDHGQTVSSGIYFYRLQAGEMTDTKKMILLK